MTADNCMEEETHSCVAAILSAGLPSQPACPLQLYV